MQDLAGNVWEWCLNEYEHPERIDPSGTVLRVLRGGSGVLNPVNARAFSRFRADPDDGNRYDGFRLCCSSPIPAEH